jgi:hypothetical protein
MKNSVEEINKLSHFELIIRLRSYGIEPRQDCKTKDLRKSLIYLAKCGDTFAEKSNDKQGL